VRTAFRSLGLIVLSLTGCHQAPSDTSGSPAIVGAWIVRAPDTSDSNLMGAWVADAGGFKGKVIEITADRTTHQFVSRGEISFALKVSGNAFSGTAHAVFYDVNGRQVRGPLQARLEGERVLP